MLRKDLNWVIGSQAKNIALRKNDFRLKELLSSKKLLGGFGKGLAESLPKARIFFLSSKYKPDQRIELY